MTIMMMIIMIMVIVDSHDDCCKCMFGLAFKTTLMMQNGLIDILDWLKTLYGAKIFVEQTLVGSPEG